MTSRRRGVRALALSLAAAAGLARGAAWAGIGSSEVGTTAAQFLKLPIDARGAAMGGAMGASVQDVSAVHWNPAGLAGLASRQAMVSYMPYLEDVNYGFVGFAQPVEALVARPRRELPPTGLGSIAAGVVYLNAGPLPETTNDCPTNAACKGGTFTPADIAALAGWGGSVTRLFDLGVTLKLISSRIHSKTASTAAADFGARLRLRAGPVPYAFAASVHNAGGSLKFREKANRLPALARLSAAAQVLPALLVTFEQTIPSDNSPYASVGSELAYAVDPRLGVAARVGYNGLTSRRQLEGNAGLTFGGGLAWSRMSLDYAWQPYGSLGDVHRFTLGYRF